MERIKPEYFTLSATIVGLLLLENTSSDEENALGNWLMLVSQILCTNAYFKQQQDINNINKQSININTLEKMVDALNKEINILKSKK